MKTSRFAIAQYWCALDEFVSDLGEPSCFACGFYKPSWDKHAKISKRWEESKLERAHIIADSLGGEDAPHNLLLLCPTCHIEAPMTNEPKWILLWARKRENFRNKQHRQVMEEYMRMGGDVAKITTIPLEEYKNLFDTLGIASHPENSYTAPSNLAVLLLAAQEWEREAIGERTRDAMRHKKANGERVGTLQYGYRLKADGVQLEPDEAEQAVLSRIGELRASGLSVRAIAAELNREGFRTRRGTEWRHQYVASLIGREG